MGRCKLYPITKTKPLIPDTKNLHRAFLSGHQSFNRNGDSRIVHRRHNPAQGRQGLFCGGGSAGDFVYLEVRSECHDRAQTGPKQLPERTNSYACASMASFHHFEAQTVDVFVRADLFHTIHPDSLPFLEYTSELSSLSQKKMAPRWMSHRWKMRL